MMPTAKRGDARRRRPRAFQQIVAAVREDVFRRRLAPGDRLPNEPDLAERFQVSRLAVREALRVLELQGIVRVEHGYRGGAYVAEGGTAPVAGALETMLRLEQLDRDEIYAARRAIEPEVAALAARAVDEATLSALREIVAESERRLAARRPAFQSNLEFHLVLAAASGNRVLTLMTSALLELLRTVESRRPSDRTVNREACQAHRAILEALRKGDAGRSRSLMTRHLDWLERHFADARAKR